MTREPFDLRVTWRRGQAAPEYMASYYEGAAVVYESTAYFSSGCNVYSYTVHEDTWTKLPVCKYGYSALAVIRDKLTTIGGWDNQLMVTNSLLSLIGNAWEESFPPMPTNRMHPAAVSSSTYLVVAGGRKTQQGDSLATVEVMNTDTLQWSTASSLPEVVGLSQMVICAERFYLSNSENDVFSCCVADLLQSIDSDSGDGDSVWTRLPNIPTQWYSSLATLKGRVLAIGGADGDSPTGNIHCYDTATNSWSVVGEMPTPRSAVLPVVLPSNDIVVVGGRAPVSASWPYIDVGSYS